MQLGHSPIVHVLPAAHGVREVDFPVVAIIHVRQRGSDAALGHHRVSFAEKRFANDADRHARRRRLDGRPQSGAAGADDQHVVFECLVFGHEVR